MCVRAQRPHMVHADALGIGGADGVPHNTPLYLVSFGRAIHEQAAYVVTRCAGSFSDQSVVDLFLMTFLNFTTQTAVVLSFFQWYGGGPVRNLYYRLTMVGGVLVNSGINALIAYVLAPQASPAWPPCGVVHAMPPYPVQLSHYFLVVFTHAVGDRELVSGYQVVVAHGVVSLVTLAHVAFGYSSPVQALAGALLGGALGIAWHWVFYARTATRAPTGIVKTADTVEGATREAARKVIGDDLFADIFGQQQQEEPAGPPAAPTGVVVSRGRAGPLLAKRTSHVHRPDGTRTGTRTSSV